MAEERILDGHVPSHCAVRLLQRENLKWKYVEVRCSKHLNNIIEQDHRAIKRQFSLAPGRRPRLWPLKQRWEWALA